jgi:hypothetical protein
MKRTKRTTIRRIALGLAVAAVIPATAQARPQDLSGSDARAIHQASLQQSSGVEIPYLSHGVGVSAGDFEPVLGPDDRSFSRSSESTATGAVEIPYLSHGVGVSPSDFGQPLGVDDRALSRQTETEAVTVSGQGGSSDIDTNTVGGLVLILAAAGMALVIRHNRKARLSPA